MKGFTLIEIVVVIVIMGIIATVALRSIDKTLETTKTENTKREMEQLTYAIAGNPNLYTNGMRTDFGYVGDIGAMPPNLDALVTNPGSYSTWKGPYMSNSFSESSTDYKLDAWGKAYSYSGVTIQSTGGSNTLTKLIAPTVADLTANTVTGSVTDAGGNPPGDSASLVTVILSFPNGVGGVTDSSVSISASGAFTYTDAIPVGNHKIQAVYSSTNDTVISYVSIMPGGTTHANLRLPGAPWAESGGGGGGGGSDLEFVTGSASCPGGGNNNVEFDIYNGSSSTITLTWLIATYSHTPTAYYRKVKCDGSVVFDSSNPRAASGDTASFTPSQLIWASEVKTIKLEDFNDTQSGVGAPVDMTNTDFTVEFSDGSTITFNSGI
ncbi:MAG: prepilin-type N-terminal cleavage/methylation domain-containing protein [candidate division Zixibacteria bacterium]|nr:prepilin-type N-terminal cleavage/methylation domain-containing protein [candidate division Zixibacteria bacterium]